MNKNVVIVEPNNYYHIYNRGINRRTLFKDDADCIRFLSIVERYLPAVGHLLSYALMGNHYHLTVLIKPKSEIASKLLIKPHTDGNTFGLIQNAYANYFNFRHSTVSGLFENPFERIKVGGLEYLQSLILYHHYNPEKHGITDNFRDYYWTSYQELSHLEIKTIINRDLVYSKFGGQEAFFTAHSEGVPNNFKSLGLD